MQPLSPPREKGFRIEGVMWSKNRLPELSSNSLKIGIE